MSRTVERRIHELELATEGAGQPVLFRIIFHSSLMAEGSHYRETRQLMEKCSGERELRYIRTLEPGELVEGIDNPPWLVVGDDEDEDPEAITIRWPTA